MFLAVISEISPYRYLLFLFGIHVFCFVPIKICIIIVIIIYFICMCYKHYVLHLNVVCSLQSIQVMLLTAL